MTRLSREEDPSCNCKVRVDVDGITSEGTLERPIADVEWCGGERLFDCGEPRLSMRDLRYSQHHSVVFYFCTRSGRKRARISIRPMRSTSFSFSLSLSSASFFSYQYFQDLSTSVDHPRARKNTLLEDERANERARAQVNLLSIDRDRQFYSRPIYFFLVLALLDLHPSCSFVRLSLVNTNSCLIVSSMMTKRNNAVAA